MKASKLIFLLISITFILSGCIGFKSGPQYEKEVLEKLESRYEESEFVVVSS